MLARFLNADLELWHTQSITPVIRALQPEMFTLYAGPECGLVGPRRRSAGHYAKLELSNGPMNPKPEEVAEEIAKLVEGFPKSALDLWHRLRVRRLSFGYDAHPRCTAGVAVLNAKTVSACLRIRLEVEVCIFPASFGSKQPYS